MSKILKSTNCLSCGGIAFRTDRPYGDFCSMMCALRGIQTEDEKEEERKQIREILKRAKEYGRSQNALKSPGIGPQIRHQAARPGNPGSRFLAGQHLGD